MSVSNTGQACQFTLINPALDRVIDAALVTVAAQRARADAQLIGGNRQVLVSYTPSPGYSGPDRFGITLEPGATGVAVDVTVQAGG